jgi:hypothetical protein
MVKRCVWLLATTLTIVGLSAISTPAFAGIGGDGGGTGTSTPPPVVNPVTTPSTPGTTTHGTVGSCSLYGGPNGFGVSCANASGQLANIKTILAGQPLPGCWDDPLPADEQDGLDTAHYSWYLQTCLTGIDPTTLAITSPTGKPVFSVQLVWFPKDPAPTTCPSVSPQPTVNPACVITLTRPQRTLVDVEAHDQVIPFPTAIPTPGGTVVVNKPVAFVDSTPTRVGPLDESDDGLGTITMQAVMIGYVVHPLGDDTTIPDCSGTVAANPGDTPASLPAACWYTYKASSAGKGTDDQYPAYAVATWVIQYSTDGGATWTNFNTFTKTGQTPVPVKEIQTVVVGS